MASSCPSFDQLNAAHDIVLFGVLNLTPDSFYDGGRLQHEHAIEAQMQTMVAEGVHVFDLGAESTRPGAEPVSPAEQIRRLEPALKLAPQFETPLSIDTTSAEVAAHCLAAGASVINDISCLKEAKLAEVVAEHQASLLLMHSRGSMTKMAGFSQYPDDGYQDVVADVKSEWSKARDQALAAGIPAKRIIFDPGLGFHKNAQQSFELLQSLESFHDLGHEILVGASRKSFIGSVNQAPAEERLGGSIAVALRAQAAGARYLRVHDVGATRQALLVANACVKTTPRFSTEGQVCTQH